jgi:hypothetical protein
MLESMLGPDTMKKIKVYLMGSVFVMLAFAGMVMIFYTSIVPPFHAYLWPTLMSVACAGAWFIAKSKGLKMGLAGIAFLAGLWILLNSIMGWVVPPEGSWIDELFSPPNMALAATGALLVIFGSLAGIMGAQK